MVGQYEIYIPPVTLTYPFVEKIQEKQWNY